MSYLSVRNFPRYQHYKDREPIWIKWHQCALADKKLRGVSPAAHHLWPYLLLMSARYENAIPNAPGAIAKETGIAQRTVAEGVAGLVQSRLVIETKTPRRISVAASREAQRKTGWRRTKSMAAEHYVRDPAGTDSPPPWWKGAVA